MTARLPEISGSAIVIIGSFNPSIFQPQWFVRQGLLSEAEGENAEIKIMVQQVCHFETDRFILFVTPDRFTALSKPNASPAPLRDLVAGTFYILEHTPVKAMGLNHQMHFAMESTKMWHQVGDTLAPKDSWNGILDGRPGLISMTIRSEMPEVKGALVHAKVEPSTQVREGVYFEINEHYPAPDEEPLKALLARLLGRWEDAQIYATRIVDHILAYASREHR